MSILLCSGANAQTDNGYSLDEYTELRARADASYAHVEHAREGTNRHQALVETAIEDRIALVRYLGAWTRSGTLPDEMEESAYETRIVLYQNIIALNVAVGNCSDARSMVDRMEQIVEENGETSMTDDALAEANTDALHCGNTEMVTHRATWARCSWEQVRC